MRASGHFTRFGRGWQYRITARQFGCRNFASENQYRLAAALGVANLELTFDANTDFAFDSAACGVDVTVTQHWIGMPGSQISVGGTVPTNTNTDLTASRFVIQANKFKMTNMVFAEHTTGNASTLTVEADDFEAVNCHFNDNANGNLPVVLLYSALRSRFRGCRFTAASTQADAELVRVGDPNSTSGTCEDILFTDTYWDGVYGGEYGFSNYCGIRLCDVNSFTMLRSSYEDLWNGGGVRIHGTMSGSITNVVIAECIVREDNNYFGPLVDFDDTAVEGLLIRGNVIKDYGRDLCYIAEGNDIAIVDNVCGTDLPGGTNYPISVRPGASMDRLLIDGNYSRGGGIQVNPASGGQIDDVTISNNFCARIECNNNNSTSGINNRLTIEGNTCKMGTDWSAMSEVIMVDGHSAGDEWQTVRICNNHMHSDNAGDDLLGTEHLIDVWVMNNTGSGSGNMTWENATAITDLQADHGNPWNSREIAGTAAPTGGTWAVGDRVWNESPTAGGTLMWVCTTAGTPGTWKTVSIDA